MGAKTARRRRCRRLHGFGTEVRIQRYVSRELRRIWGKCPQALYAWFRVHPEFGHCERELNRQGCAVVETGRRFLTISLPA